ncbi:MAG: two-component regulator propeller domain-containing protein [Cytophagales bacterium]|nr:two-component regulator propeller domain-containing protein [Cytophagales bacterium]
MIKNTFFIIFCANIALAQELIPIGEWRTHTSLMDGKAVAATPDRVYCGTRGGLYYYDKADESVNRIWKKDGLSGTKISAMAYSTASQKVVIGYENGNIDILHKNTIINVPGVLNSNITGNKKINHIHIYNTLAYLSCDFGILVLNLNKNEIKETYRNIDKSDTTFKINSLTINNDTIYAATAYGLYKSSHMSKNLMDANNWKKIKIADTLMHKPLQHVVCFQNNIYAYYDLYGIFMCHDNIWHQFSKEKVQYLATYSNKNRLLWSKASYIYSYNGTITDTIKYYTAFGNAIDTDENNIWIAEYNKGLVKISIPNYQFGSYIPASPKMNNPYKIVWLNDYIYTLAGGYDLGDLGPSENSLAFARFEAGQWNNFDKPYSGVPYMLDIVDATYNRYSNKAYFASHNRGLWVLDVPKNEYTLIDEKHPTCPINKIPGFGSYLSVVRVSGAAADENSGTTWFTSIGEGTQNPTLFSIDEKNNCRSYYIPIENAIYPLNIIIDNQSNKWVLPRLDLGGLIVFNEKKITSNNIPAYQFFATGKGLGNLSSNNVRCMVKDKEGNVWVGTENGICVFYNPPSLANNKINDASSPIFQNRPLLNEQIITCIAVDGGNQKWIGTPAGLFVFNPDGTQLIHKFTTQNSMLPSEYIIYVAIHPHTGEVFISTDEGMVSYRSGATEGADDAPKHVKIFPNPVKANFAGTIGISGLYADANVKITDIAGTLVYETRALGGTATWNCKDYNNNKVLPGLYVILSSKDNGDFGIAGKLYVEE